MRSFVVMIHACLKLKLSYVSISFATSGSFVCREGATDVTYRDWGLGEPNNGGGNEDCGAVRTLTRKWNDIRCDYIEHAICKRPLLARWQF